MANEVHFAQVTRNVGLTSTNPIEEPSALGLLGFAILGLAAGLKGKPT